MRALWIAVALLALAGAGWLALSAINDPVESACAARVFDGSRFTVCAFDATRQTTEIVWADAKGRPYRSFDAYQLENPGAAVRFAMNAGMFEAEGAPVGLLRINGAEIRALQTGEGNGNFYLKPNGVFFIAGDGSVGIATTEDFATSDHGAVSATQSGPMLVIDGALNTAFQDDGPSRFIRNGVGVRDAGSAFLVISDDEVSFGKLARFFREALKCSNALYFDGAVSSLWAPSLGRDDAEHLFGPFVVVLETKAKR